MTLRDAEQTPLLGQEECGLKPRRSAKVRPWILRRPPFSVKPAAPRLRVRFQPLACHFQNAPASRRPSPVLPSLLPLAWTWPSTSLPPEKGLSSACLSPGALLRPLSGILTGSLCASRYTVHQGQMDWCAHLPTHTHVHSLAESSVPQGGKTQGPSIKTVVTAAC